jgi:UDP-N-acetylglucosamine acyltransferase
MALNQALTQIQVESGGNYVNLGAKMIHSTAIIHPQARLAAGVQVGPFAVIDAGVEVGPDCWIGPHVYLTGLTKIGRGNKFHAGAVIGDAPQDLKYRDDPTGVAIGDDNVFREHATVHRSTKVGETTVIGSHNFLMANAHVAHNCVVGNHVIIANGALLAGHVVVQDRAFISGNCLIHQFCRVGTLAIMRGGSAISKDLPPFTVSRGENHISGLNIIGLRRAGFDAAERLELKKLYHSVFRSDKLFKTALAEAEAAFTNRAARIMLEFLAAAKRGVCADRGKNRSFEDAD